MFAWASQPTGLLFGRDSRTWHALRSWVISGPLGSRFLTLRRTCVVACATATPPVPSPVVAPETARPVAARKPRRVVMCLDMGRTLVAGEEMAVHTRDDASPAA